MKLFVVSDVHYDIAGPKALTRVVTDSKALDYDALVCLGDIHNEERGLARFLESFKHVDSKYYVWGNHCLWATAGNEPRLVELARAAGWRTMDPGLPYQVVDEALLFRLYYRPQPSWQAWHGNDLRYTNDHQWFDVERFVQHTETPIPGPVNVKWSASHMQPTAKLPNEYEPHCMYVNPDIDAVLRAAGSPLHLFGHTHQRLDKTLDGVRYVNRSATTRDYGLVMKTESFLVDQT